LYGSLRTVNEGGTQKTVTADDEYIISSIYDPNKEIAEGYARNLMQSYRELLTLEQIAVMTEYLKTLSKDGS
jgi:cytochrome c oxidase subunit 2